MGVCPYMDIHGKLVYIFVFLLLLMAETKGVLDVFVCMVLFVTLRITETTTEKKKSALVFLWLSSNGRK